MVRVLEFLAKIPAVGTHGCELCHPGRRQSPVLVQQQGTFGTERDVRLQPLLIGGGQETRCRQSTKLGKLLTTPEIEIFLHGYFLCVPRHRDDCPPQPLQASIIKMARVLYRLTQLFTDLAKIEPLEKEHPKRG